MSSKPLFTIGIISELLQVHQRTLRIYDFEGILIPARNSKNRRLYSQNDLEKAKLILYLTKNLALNLSGVKTILSLFEELNVENIAKAENKGRKPNFKVLK